MKVAIFGGTFNPPHNTHVKIARAAAEICDKLIVMPCGIPPHKSCDVDAEVRLRLARLAFPFACVSDSEIKKQGKSYTVETLREIKEQYPSAQLLLVIGGDSLRDFDGWYRPDEICRLATLVVAHRSHKTFETTVEHVKRKYGAQVVFLDVQPDDVSSTEIRLRCQFGLDNPSLPAEVARYIEQNHLYQKFLPMTQKVKEYLTDERFRHTFYVVKRGMELAEKQKLSPEDQDKVFVACLLHDCAKYVPPERYGDYGFEKPADMPPPVVHSFLGALVAKRDFGITDEEILSAITFHTTGCPDMSVLQKIVYVADKTEQTRPYPLSHLISGSLDCQLKKCLWEANGYTQKTQKKNIYPLSLKTLEFYFPNSVK